MNVVFHGTLVFDLQELLLGKLTTAWRVQRFHERDAHGAFAAALAEADALITMTWDRDFPPAPALKLIQLAGTGYDAVDFDAVPAGVAVCNCYGHAEAMAEYTLLAMLLWCQRFIEADRTFRAGSWQYSGRFAGPMNDELCGKTVGIVGVGSIGRAIARRVKAFDARVLGCNRTLRADAADLDGQYSLDRIDEFLPQCDFVVVAAALAPATEGLIDRRRIGLMKPSAVLINVGRGAIVDEDALFEVLRDGVIRGATIDAWYRYPSHEHPDVTPSRHPFHTLPNVHMTPHSSGWTSGMIDRRWNEVAGNLDRLARGEPLANIVRAPRHDSA
jgi:phosphoglycerate dehydrogenase-like enzyme